MKMRLPLLLACLCAGGAIHAEEQRWAVRFGLHHINPKSDNGSLAGGTLDASIDSDLKPSVALEYYFSPHWSLDILAAVPFKHTVSLNGAEAVELTHLPPTVSIEYHFAPDAELRPFVGLGVNYTLIYDEKARGPLAGTRVGLDNSFGLAAQVGLEWVLDERWSIVADARWMDIDTDVTVNGSRVGTAEVDPLALGLTAAWRF